MLSWNSTFLCQTLSMISSSQKVWPRALRQFYCYLYRQVGWTKPQDAEDTGTEPRANTINGCGDQDRSSPRVGRGKDKTSNCDLGRITNKEFETYFKDPSRKAKQNKPNPPENPRQTKLIPKLSLGQNSLTRSVLTSTSSQTYRVGDRPASTIWQSREEREQGKDPEKGAPWAVSSVEL